MTHREIYYKKISNFLQVDPLSTISATWPKVIHGHQHDIQPEKQIRQSVSSEKKTNAVL